MKRHFIGIALIVSFLGVSPTRAQNSASGEVRASGEAEVVRRDFARARKEAIEDAMNLGIMEVAKEFFEPAAFTRIRDVVEVRLGEKKGRLVKDYRLLAERRGENKFQVELLLVPLRAEVRQELIRWGILFDRAKKPTFYVNALTGTEGSIWTQRLKSRFYDLGYEAAPRAADADVSVSGSVGSEGKKTFPVRMEMQMKTPARKYPTHTVNLDREWSGNEAAGFLVTDVLRRVLPAWIKATGSGRVYEVEVTGFRNNVPLEELRKALNSDELGFSDGRDLVYVPGAVIFQTVYEGEVGSLVKTLGRVSLAGSRLKVVGVQDRRVRVEIVKP